MNDLTHKIVNGFTLQHKLGEGGMAEVWKAENEIEKLAAVKILRKDLSLNEDIVVRFKDEAKTMVKLEHPNIRQVYSFGNINDQPCIIMEYLEGDDLKNRINNKDSFTNEELQSFWNQCVDALNYTHKSGVIHRDIKPSNLFLTNDKKIKILDFGIAKVRDSISVTQTGTRMGTLMYMSPEQVRDSKHLDHKSDIYSLAISFYYIISGNPPYDCENDSAFDIQEKIVRNEFDISDLPDNWIKILTPLLHKDPEKRNSLYPIIGQYLINDKSNDNETNTHKTQIFNIDISDNLTTNNLKESPLRKAINDGEFERFLTTNYRNPDNLSITQFYIDLEKKYGEIPESEFYYYLMSKIYD